MRYMYFISQDQVQHITVSDTDQAAIFSASNCSRTQSLARKLPCPQHHQLLSYSCSDCHLSHAEQCPKGVSDLLWQRYLELPGSLKIKCSQFKYNVPRSAGDAAARCRLKHLAHRHEIEMTPQSRYSCVTCARRKVKCDKLSPCSTCSKSQVACIYRDPVPSQRYRKRVTQRDLLSKIQELETILHSNRIPFEALGNSWISSHWEERLSQSPQTQAASIETATTAEVSPQAHFAENLHQSTNNLLHEQAVAARLWSELPEVVRALFPVQHSVLTNSSPS